MSGFVLQNEIKSGVQTNPFRPFQCVDMGEKKVCINYGVLLNVGTGSYVQPEDFVGDVEPQFLEKDDIDVDKLLDVELDDFICIVITDDEPEIKALSESEITSQSFDQLFRLARIEEVDGEGAEAILTIENLYDGHVFTGVGGGGASCPAWKPRIVNEGSDETPDWKFKLGFGAVNSVALSNANESKNITGSDDYWVVLTVTSSNGEVQTVTYDLESSPPVEDQVNSGTPPASIKIILGMVSNLSSCITYEHNIEVSPYEVYRTSKPSIAYPGEEPFIRHYRWVIYNLSAP